MEQVNELIDRWAAAELAGDVDAYGTLLTPDFRGIGPVGFVLDRDQWAARHTHGLVNHEFRVEERELRAYGDDTVVVTAVETQRTVAKGQENNGAFRVVALAVREDDTWRLAHVQFSGPLRGGPGRPRQ